MNNKEIHLMAHLMRRAGFGATRDDLEAYAAKGYEATLKELLKPSDPQRMGDDLLRRYHQEQSGLMAEYGPPSVWLYRIITTNAPLIEKVALF